MCQTDNKVLGCFKSVAQLTIAGVKTIFKKRKNGARIFILSFATIFIVFMGVEDAVRSIDYLFYRLQYVLTDTSYSNLTTLQTTLKLLCQVLVETRSEVDVEQNNIRWSWSPF